MDNSFEEIMAFNKRKIVIAIIILVLVIMGGSFYIYNQYFKTAKEPKDDSSIVLEKVNAEENSNDENEEEIKEEEKKTSDSTDCFFDIKGEIKKPGVYSINCSSRVINAINMAGGLTKNSDTSVINLSKKIEDGMVIIVYSKTEVNNYLKTLAKEENKKKICQDGKIENGACISSDDKSNSSVEKNNADKNTLININTASLEQLMTLSGIGEAKAKNIIAYRSKTPFKKIDDLLNVDGIGESIYSNIKKNITV